jgi:thymidylate synthase ThyX
MTETKMSATIVADSINLQGDRITSLLVVFPRIVMAEFLTHRMFSRNAASSRAIPFKKMVKDVMENPFIPLAFQKHHSGMQGTEYITDEKEVHRLRTKWQSAMIGAAEEAEKLHNLGVTKQLCNRLLEPFQYITVLVTATEWENFFKLRIHPDAEIHINHLAKLIKEARDNSTPKQLKEGEWHIPFGDTLRKEAVLTSMRYREDVSNLVTADEIYEHYMLKIATARCARLSYMTLGAEPKIDYAADIRLHDMLLESEHFSPFEHCAKAMSDEEYNSYFSGKLSDVFVAEPYDSGEIGIDGIFTKNSNGWCRNFRGFISYRHLISK